MAIVDITPKKENYFVQVNEDGQRSPISQLEISGIFRPEFLGKVIVQDYEKQDSIAAQLMAMGRELTASTDQVTWKEEDNDFSITSITGKGLITRAADVFTLNTASINADPYDIDTNRPEDAQFIVTVGMNFIAAGANGKMDHGQITSVANDNKSFTATIYGEGKSAWTCGTEDIDLVFTGLDLDHCECPTGIGYKTYAPTRENTMQKDGESVDYCDETLANENAGQFDLLELDADTVVMPDENLDRAIMKLIDQMDNRIAFGDRKTLAQAQALGQKSIGMKGLIPTIESRGLKVEGMIETLDDLERLALYLKKQKIKKATLRCTDAQKTKLNKIVPPDSHLHIDPFTDNTKAVYYVGFGGVNINGVEIIFKEWNALNDLSENIAMRYNYIVIPEGDLTKVINGTREKVGYLNIVWFKGLSKVYKFLRDVDGEEKKCMKTKIDFLNKMTITVHHPEKFILGINIAA